MIDKCNKVCIKINVSFEIVFFGKLDQVFDKQWVALLRHAFIGDSEEIFSLHTSSFLKHSGNRFLNFLVRVIQVNKDGFDRVLV